MIGMCWRPTAYVLPIQTLTGLTIKECQLRCQTNPKCNFFKSLYPHRRCSLWRSEEDRCDGYLGVSNSILKTCGKGDQIGLWNYRLTSKMLNLTVKIRIYITLFYWYCLISILFTLSWPLILSIFLRYKCHGKGK